MKHSSDRIRSCPAFLLWFMVTAFQAATGLAQSGTWTSTGSGLNWSAPENWAGGIVADGAGNAADFGTLDITADVTVHLDSGRTLGSLTFGDLSTNTPAGWTLDNSGVPANILTLDGAAPTITVGQLGPGRTVTNSCVCAGTNGLAKAGDGRLKLTAANTYSNGVHVTGGTLSFIAESGLGSVPPSFQASHITLENGAVLELTALLDSDNQGSSVTLDAKRGITLSSGLATIQRNHRNQNYVINGVISGSGGVIFRTLLGGDQGGGSGFELYAANTYTGDTWLAWPANIEKGAQIKVYNSLAFQNTTLYNGNFLGFTENAGRATIYTFNVATVVLGGLAGGTNGVQVKDLALPATALLVGNNNRDTAYYGTLSGSGKLVKMGTGTLTLARLGTYTGDTTVSNGTLRAGAANVIPSGAGKGNLTFTPDSGQTALFDLNGSNQTVNGLSSSGAGASIVDNLAGSGTCALTVGANGAGGTFGGSLRNTSGTLDLIKTGSGTLALSGNNTFSGATSVSGGKLVGVSGGSCSNSAITVAAGCTFGVQAATVNGVWVGGSLSFAAGGAYLSFDYSTNALSSVAPVHMGGSVDFSAVPPTVLLTANADKFQPGTYPLMTWSGSQLGALPVLQRPPFVNASLSIDGNTLNLHIASVDSHLTWAAGSGAWDVDASTNWIDAAAAPAKYQEGSAVVFEDTLSGASPITVSVAAAVSPSSVMVNSDAKAYTLSGGAIAGACGLSKSGAAALTLAGTNTFAGGVALNAGTLVLGSAGALGVTGALSIAQGTTLNSAVAGLVNAGGNAVVINGDFAFAGTQSLNLGPGAVSLGAAAGTARTVSVTNTLTLGGSISDGVTATNLVKAGTGTLVLSGAGTYSGVTTVSAGTLKLGAAGLGAAGPLGSAAAGTVVSGSGAALDLNGFTLAAAEPLSLNGTGVSGSGALLNSSPVAAAYPGLLALSGACSIVANNGGIVLSNTGAIAGSGGLTLDGISPGSSIAGSIAIGGNGLTKNGIGTWTLSGAGTYTGQTTVNAGTLKYGASDAISTGAVVINGATAVLALAGFSDSVGPVTLTSGAITGPGTLTSTSGFTMNNASDTRVSASLAGAVGLTKTGAGTVALSGNNAYSGATAVNAGRLLGVTGGGCVNSSVNVNNAANGVVVAAPGQQWTCANLAYTSGTAAVVFDFGANSPSTNVAPLQVSGGVNFLVTPNVVVTGSGAFPATLAAGASYPLMTWAGAMSGTPPATTNLVLPARMAGSLAVSNSTLWLTVDMNAQPLTWTAAAGSGWDIGATANWKDGTNAAALYQQGDAVVFDDSVTGAPSVSVTLGVDVAPLSVMFSNTARAYTLSGSGRITGAAGLTKAGTGEAVLSGAHLYTGGTTVRSGTLRVNNAAGSGTGTGGVTVNGGATLAGRGIISGPVAVAAGGHLSPGTNSVGTLTLSGDGVALDFGSGAVLDCEIGGTDAAPVCDLVNLTGVNSTIAFGAAGALNLRRAAGATLDPKGRTFVLFDYTGSDPVLPLTWAITHFMTGWGGGSVSLDTANRRVILTGVREQLGSGALLIVR